MKLKNTKALIKIYENLDHLGADQALSLMMGMMSDIREESKCRIGDLELVSEPGNEEAFLVALKSVALEVVNVMKKINPDEMEGFQKYSRQVCDKAEGVQRVADTIEQWQTLEEACRDVNNQIAEEEKKLQEKKKQLETLEREKKELEDSVAASCMTEEACLEEIKRLKEQLKSVPESEQYLDLQKRMKKVRKHYETINQLVTDFLEDYSEEKRLEMKFELSEEKCEEYLQTIADRIGKLEKYYSEMLKYDEEQRSLRES